MAADYAGALDAIKNRFVDSWANATPIAFVNDNDPIVVDESGNDVPWVFFEVLHSGSWIAGSGTPGNQVIVYDGLIKGRVFSPIKTGLAVPMAKAIAIGEIFRNRVFYDNVTAGCYVRTGYDRDGQPRIDEGDSFSDDGKWFAVTATIPFHYYHRG